MSDSLQHPSLPRRIRFTPLRDVLRARFTGRLDVKHRIASSDIPEPAKALVARVVRRTRLWRLERVAVADELIAHFTDGLAAGESIDDLIGSFGDERRAARLIRRAKRRGRSLASKALAAAGWSGLITLSAYVLIGVYLYTGRATPGKDYLALANNGALKTPPEQRAWPTYRTALLTLRKADAAQPGVNLSNVRDARPGWRHWDDLVRWIDGPAAREVVRLALEASGKPSLGFIIGPHGSADDPELWPHNRPTAPRDEVEALRRKLNEFGDNRRGPDLWSLGDVVAADARVASERRETARYLADLEALRRMAEHLRQAPSISEQYTAQYLMGERLALLDLTLTRSPDLLNEEHLRQIAHALTGPEYAADLFDLGWARMEFANWVQLLYTDNGRDSGRITLNGLRALSDKTPIYDSLTKPDEPITAIMRPALFAIIASRADVTRTFDRLIGEVQARLEKPARELNPDVNDDPFEALADSDFMRWRYLTIVQFRRHTSHLHRSAERYLSRRDAILAAIALELHARRHGSYPRSLGELTPGYLPSIPVDRITGGPLSYRLVDGKPVIYSLGPDKDDDGGRLPIDKQGRPAWWLASYLPRSGQPIPDGDWVLYPSQPPEPEEQVNEP